MLNAVAKGLLNFELIDKSEFYEDLAVITELGLPNVLSAKVFYGVSSRVSAFEISTHLDIGLESESLDTIKDTIIEQKNLLKGLCSSDTQQWLNIFTIQKISNEVDISKFPLFIIAKVKTDKLYFRENLDSLYLSSNDYSEFVKVREDKRDLFKGIDQNNGYYLERVPTTDKWKVIKC
ncbi:MAG: hypothetical protein IPN33_04450 [Saprospiraceae bacterium]|nr:hypothetical protein [Saprospiraceae bacterium]